MMIARCMHKPLLANMFTTLSLEVNNVSVYEKKNKKTLIFVIVIKTARCH